ncbi:hypothetical protein DPEC_G00372970 [Dallia pectoralis]|nr:hypothetical protein DPEC_G00372970 [Dallia pectoralis]
MFISLHTEMGDFQDKRTTDDPKGHIQHAMGMPRESVKVLRYQLPAVGEALSHWSINNKKSMRIQRERLSSVQTDARDIVEEMEMPMVFPLHEAENPNASFRMTRPKIQILPYQ